MQSLPQVADPEFALLDISAPVKCFLSGRKSEK
jgi:hypothetical protein